MTTIPTLFSGSYYAIPASSNSSSALPVQTPTATLFLKAVASGGDDSSDKVILSAAAQSALGDSSSTTFKLTAAQQQQVTQIINKYANAPQTQDTFDAIQDDLKAAGLSPEQLAAKQSASSYNLQGEELEILNDGALSGNYSTPDYAAQQTKATNYINHIYSQYQAIASASTGITGTAGGIDSATAAQLANIDAEVNSITNAVADALSATPNTTNIVA